MITNYTTENKRCNTIPSVVYTSVPPGDASMFINVFITEDNFGFGGTFGRILFFGIVFECTFTRSPCDVLQSCLQFDNSAQICSNLDISYSKSLKIKRYCIFLSVLFWTLAQTPYCYMTPRVLRAPVLDWHNHFTIDGCCFCINYTLLPTL